MSDSLDQRVHEALRLMRTGRTVFLARPPFLSEPCLTTRIPCGRTLSFSLGRAVDGVMPTAREIREDLVAGMQQLGREERRAA